MITKHTITIDRWSITIEDNGIRHQKNPNKLNFKRFSSACMFKGCGKVIRKNRTSGLCDAHESHQSDLLLILMNPSGSKVRVPQHTYIIDVLDDWSRSRNYALRSFFEELSFQVLGNVPDVSSMSGDVIHTGMTMPTLNDIFLELNPLIERYFPTKNTSSHQILYAKSIEIPAIVLIHAFIGLLVCEEANRGDRWFCRNIMHDERKTTQLGAAMPIAYYAAKSFSWGVELGKASDRLVVR
jgi:hypothetical protein